MDLPKPPDDPELKNIIDKLANFVARNGPEFENMTKQKQQDNPKFSFLFGGEHYAYYQYKVHAEQAIINIQNKKMQEHAQQMMHQEQQQQQQQQPPPLLGGMVGSHLATPMSGPPPLLGPPPMSQWQSTVPPLLPNTAVVSVTIETPSQVPMQTPQQQAVASLQQQIAIQQQQIQNQSGLNDTQIKQSEQNLAAQYTSLMQQQQFQIEDTLEAMRHEELQQLAAECSVSLDDLNVTVKPIIDSCTKDAILSGKSWIFQHCTSDAQTHLVTKYLLRRIVAKEASFELRLHLIYLINDLLHHCQRKNADILKEQLERIVVPVFCTAHVGAGDDKKAKLNKLLTLWEQNKYFSMETIEKMKDPDQALSKFHADLLIENGGLVSQISSGVQMQYQSLQKQHNDFVTHLQAQLQQLQSHLSHLQTQLAQAQAAVITQSIASQIAVSAPPLDVISQQTQDGFQPNRPQGFNPSPFGPSMAPFNRPPMGPGPGGPGTQPMHPPPFDYHAPWAGPPPPVSSAGPPGFPLPDFSKPPPGFPPAGIPRLPPPDIDLTPAVPYYELPAGLMAPLVKLEDHDYRPLDPRDIRLPPPMPPSDRLLAAVEAFYSPPFHDRPRDSEGWEKLGLYEFFKAKQKARKMKEQDEESRSRSRSLSGSRSQSRSRSQSGSESGSRSGSQSPKREPSPPPRRRRYNSDSNNSPERQDRSKSNSPLPYRQSSNSPPPRRRSPSPPPRRRERSRSPSEERERSKSRSPTPPMFSTDQFLAAAAAAKTTEKLGEENKGHMLLKKMGWGGKGLGAKEQGIVNPIEAAEVRDRTDMYKGIGNEHDPFEQFRKNKAQGFITRMQAREIPPTEVKKKRPDT